MSRMSELLSREEIMFKQRSRLDWLKEGDRNTAFFHAKSRERAQTNRISALRKEDGTAVTSQEDMETEAMDFYLRLFTRQEELDPGPILNCVPERVTSQMNDLLLKPFKEEEVREALFMMNPNKAPGPDGLTAGFYQHHWELIRPAVTRAVLDFLSGGDMPEKVNLTTIVLIPKVRQPQAMKQYRPISLCNVVYKICSKLLANRMRPFLDDIVSEEQSAFVPGRLITDNVLVGYDMNAHIT